MQACPEIESSTSAVEERFVVYPFIMLAFVLIAVAVCQARVGSFYSCKRWAGFLYGRSGVGLTSAAKALVHCVWKPHVCAMKERVEASMGDHHLLAKQDAPTIVRQRHRIPLKHLQSDNHDDAEDSESLPARCLSPLSPTLSETSSSCSSPAQSSRKYARKEKIGQGAQGSVYRCIETATGREMAVKVIMTSELSPPEVEAIKHEVKTIKRLPPHPNLVQYFKATEKKAKQLSIYMEFVAGGSLSSRLRQQGALPLELAKKYTRQLCEALRHLHQNRIAHRDIKCANVFLISSGDEVKLGDFGALKEVGAASLVAGLKGTPHWMAPEVIRAEQQTSEDGWFKADIWSLGCAIIEMLTGHSPWQQYSNPLTAMYQIVSSNNTPTIPADATEETASFLHRCLQRNPAERASIDTLLLHPFVRSSQVDVHQVPAEPPHPNKSKSPQRSPPQRPIADDRAVDAGKKRVPPLERTESRSEPQQAVSSPLRLRKVAPAPLPVTGVETNQPSQRIDHDAITSKKSIKSNEVTNRPSAIATSSKDPPPHPPQSYLRKPSVNPKLKPLELIRSPSNQEKEPSERVPQPPSITRGASNGLPRLAAKHGNSSESIAITPVRLRRISTAPARETEDILGTPLAGMPRHKLPPLSARPTSSAASTTSSALR